MPAKPWTRNAKRLTGFCGDFDKTTVVTRCGRICLGNEKINSARPLLAKPSASKKFMMTFGW